VDDLFRSVGRTRALRRSHMKFRAASSATKAGQAARDTAVNWQQQNAGFSLIEISLVMLIGCAVAGFAVMNITEMLPAINANGSMHQIVAQLRNGRELAVAQRRNIQVLFQNSNQIQLVRNDVPSGSTLLSTSTLEHGCRFHLFDGIPDSPDSFGNAAAVDFGAASTMTFLSDGTLVDEEGNPLSGSVFLGIADSSATARAVTILGATGRIRSYRWTGTSWIQ
jgi:prepilin-type N-terminal cleavage/methylation domain-containing protein